MHVALAADGRRVAELLRDALDRGDDVALCLGLAVVFLELGQRQRRQHGPGPGAEILGAEVLARNVFDVSVDVAGPQRTAADFGAPNRQRREEA